MEKQKNNKKRLTVCVMGQNCEKFIGMCLESVKEADNIIYLDGGSTDKSLDVAEKYKAKLLYNEFKQYDKLMNSKQRNFYLDYLKKNHMNEWVLVLDADEIVDNLGKIKELIQKPLKELIPMISIKMRHFENTLGTEDKTVEEHFVPNRLFYVTEDLYYPDGEHTVLWKKKAGVKLTNEQMGKYSGKYGGVIWHLAYCSGIFDIRKRYLNHLKKSEIHTKEFMDEWYFNHLFGSYPTNKVNPEDIPSVILKEFLIDPDKIYFMKRGNLETKHFLLSKQWLDHFKAKTVLDLGCGLGHFGFALDSYGVAYQGLEISKWAIENTPYKHLNIAQGDIREKHHYRGHDLVLVFDILEHLEEEDLDKTLEIIKDYGNAFLFSIPFIGDSNLEEDPTHKIFKEKSWWVNKLTNYFKISEVPKDFHFRNQLLIGERK